MPEISSQSEIWSVSQLTRCVKDLVETHIGAVWVSGEISNWRVSPAGHAYFTLKDDSSQVDAVMFRGRMSRMRFEPENGLEVVVLGQITVYEKRGNYQIVCEEMQPRGVGALQLAFEKLKARLSAEGLFDEALKKPLPLLPRRIGIVTSPTGAAIRDILNVIRRRFAQVHLLLYPARVQGDGAAAEIAAGVRALDAFGVDVMIVGRGGGSIEDLWPFNEEVVVRAVFEARTPVISAVGHEIDFTLTDFAADLRAPTPSAAAELVVREQQALMDQVGQARQRMAKALDARVQISRGRLDRLSGSYVFRRPEDLFRQQRQTLDDLRMRIDSAMGERADLARLRLERAARALGLLSPGMRVQRARERFTPLGRRLEQAVMRSIMRRRERFAGTTARLHTLSPLAVLGRGYALAYKEPEHELVRDAARLAPGDRIEVRFGRGSASATIEGTKE